MLPTGAYGVEASRRQLAPEVLKGLTITVPMLTFVDKLAKPQYQRKSMSSIGEEATA